LPPSRPRSGLDSTEPTLLAFTKAFGADFGLLATFGGIGLLVNGIVVYIYFQVKGEHQQNELERRERRERLGG
jgi:hypothetical protein